MHIRTSAQPSRRTAQRRSIQWSFLASAALAATFGLSSVGRAAQITFVNDTWQDATRTDPAAPTYSEMGTDGDADGLESAWFVNGGTGVPSAGHLVLTPPAGSNQNATTYFTSESSPITLASTGDFLRVTWRFTTGDVALTSTGQDFRFMVADSPSAQRTAVDASLGSGAYTGYSVFGNMAETLGNANPFQVRRRTGTGAALSAAGEWASMLNDGTSGNTGYRDATDYEMVATITRNAANGLDLLFTMTQLTGTNVLDNGTGLSVTTTDAAPTSFTFDTFHFRPSTGANTTASFFDTTLFRVEGPEIVPEPMSVGALGVCGLAAMLRRRRNV